MWLTFFSIYRVINIPVTAKLNTITDPFKGSESYLREFELMIPFGIHKFQSVFDKKFSPLTGWANSNGILPIMKAGEHRSFYQKCDPLDFTNSIVSDISKLLMKANKAGRIGYLDTLGNRF
jgi:hypothetical protein